MIQNKVQTQSEILTYINLLADQKTPIDMTKTYKGVVISEQVIPYFVDQSHVTFQAMNREICTILEGSVQLHNPLFSKPVKARVKDLSINEAKFALSEFSYMEDYWKKRTHERVQPEVPTYVTMHYQSLQYRASMLDLSVNGMGLLIGNSGDEEIEFEPNSCVRTDFETSPGFRWIKLGGAIHYKLKVARSIVRLGIRLYPKIEQARQLEKYVAQRKAEIMAEFEQASLNASIPFGVELQYF